MIDNNNFICIQGWMVNELHLKGNELLVYALIYGFSQDRESKFSGSAQYIADWCSISKHSAFDTLKKLCQKKLIIRHEKNINGVLLVKYTINKGSEKTSPVVKNFHRGSEKTSLGGSEKFSPHNIDIDNINNNIEKEIKEKESFGEYEFLRPQIEKWLSYKKERKESYKSKSSVNVFVRKLAELSNNDALTADKIIEQSIANNWAGIFALRQEKAKPIDPFAGKPVFLPKIGYKPF